MDRNTLPNLIKVRKDGNIYPGVEAGKLNVSRKSENETFDRYTKYSKIEKGGNLPPPIENPNLYHRAICQM